MSIRWIIMVSNYIHSNIMRLTCHYMVQHNDLVKIITTACSFVVFVFWMILFYLFQPFLVLPYFPFQHRLPIHESDIDDTMSHTHCNVSPYSIPSIPTPSFPSSHNASILGLAPSGLLKSLVQSSHRLFLYCFNLCISSTDIPSPIPSNLSLSEL